MEAGKLRLAFHPGQSRAWRSQARFILVLAGTRSGKALAVDTPIPTPAGFKSMGDIVAGDQVFDEYGRACSVIGISEVMTGRLCYRVTFDDGASVVADADHLWVTQDHKQRKNAGRRVANPDPSWASRPQCKPTPDFSTRTTAEIRGSLEGRPGTWNHSIGLPGDAEYPAAGLPVPPYTLGVWLGDGHTSGALVTSADPEILSYIEADGFSVGDGKANRMSGKALVYRIGSTRSHRRWGPERMTEATGLYQQGLRLTEVADAMGTCPGRVRQALKAAGVEMTRRRQRTELRERSENGTFLAGPAPVRKPDSLQAVLRRIGLIGDKHIPAAYMTSSPAQRLALLQGLMDTDGCCCDNECEFSNTNERLARQVVELCRSLGIKGRLRSKIATLNGKACALAWRVTFTTDRPVFRLARKLAAMSGSVRPDVKRRFIVSVEPVESVPVKCIAIDSPTRQYLCSRDYIPTHNSSFSPWWLWREIQRCGPGDYLLCAPSYKLLDKAAVPYLNEALGTYLRLGKLVGGAQGRFEVNAQGEWAMWRAAQQKPTRILFGHADEPESLEAAQYKAAVCDEAGQKKFKQESWEAIQRRLAIDRGRCLFPTTPYSLNWLKTEVHDRAVRAMRGTSANPAADAGYDLVSFESIMNPAFPLDEWERARATLPKWKFDLFYRGIFSRPAGAIYDCFQDDYHRMPGGFEPPPQWRLVCGIDFGAPNFAAVFGAEEPGTKRRIVFAEYRPQEARKAADHVAAMHATVRRAYPLQAAQWAAMSDRPVSEWTRLPDVCVGGSKSEGQWRAEFASHGWPIREPDQPDVEVGITRVYASFAEDRLFITDDCPEVLADVQAYSRPVDDDGNPMEGIEDANLFHSADALRYIVGYLESKVTRVGGWVLD